MSQGDIVKIRDNIHEVCAMYILPSYNGARHIVRTVALAISDSLQPCGLYSPPGSCVHGILQARILEQIAMPSSKGPSQPTDPTRVSSVSCTGRRVLYH